MQLIRKNCKELKARRILIFNKKYLSRSCFFICILSLLLLISFTGLSESKPKFLIVHLDALSSPNFFQYMEEGHFPNLKAIFQDGDGHIIPYGLALFPGGTETTVPHLRKGVDNSTGGVGWGYYDRGKEKVMGKHITFFDMFSHIPRRAKAGFIYGVPFLDFFNFYPLMNIPELLDTYNVVQFFWFATDSLGHYFGEKPYLASYKRFDSYMGRLIKRLDLDEVNLIIYSDHGMSFGRFIDNPQEKEIKRIIRDSLKIYIHPNVYLDDPAEKNYWAQKITLESEIDFAFLKEKDDEVIGYTDYGKIIFQANDYNKIRYLYEGEDVFDYYSVGYQGEWLDADEWLSLTKKSNYPGVPPNIYNLLMNEKAGDIVIVINPPKIPIFNLRYPANHAGLTKTDLLIPILLKGKELEHLYETESLWLHDLFNLIPS
ncbi:MAG: alkaline phosphatase family protein, partial [Atribacterota bacterium]|nr:alkaline phosphatase family protein [Atribacterota bacterium]